MAAAAMAAAMVKNIGIRPASFGLSRRLSCRLASMALTCNGKEIWFEGRDTRRVPVKAGTPDLISRCRSEAPRDGALEALAQKALEYFLNPTTDQAHGKISLTRS